MRARERDAARPTKGEQQMDNNAANLHDADAALEAEIARLREDEHVKLAKRYNYARNRRKQYLYQLRYYQKKGRELAALGVTMDNLDKMLCDNGGDT